MSKLYTLTIVDNETGEIIFDKQTRGISVSERFNQRVYTHGGNHFMEDTGRVETTISGEFFKRPKIKSPKKKKSKWKIGN